MDRYICIKEFYLPRFDENDYPTENYGTIEEGSVWEVSKIGGESDTRLNLVEGDSDFTWIDITKEHLTDFFVREYLAFCGGVYG